MEERYVLTEYTVPADFPHKLTLALVTDLHEREPKRVLELVRKANPDLIMVAGDTFERNRQGEDPRRKEDYGTVSRLMHKSLMWLDDLFERTGRQRSYCAEYAYRFLKEAREIAPVFMSRGNHEWYLLREDTKAIQAADTVLLDNQDCTVAAKGIWLRIGGLSSAIDWDWLEEYSKKDGYKILLCHHPEYYERYLRDKNLNLILSGHAHGGQIRIFGHGIFSPGQGMLPRYTKGVYDGKLVVSAGCANTASVPRFGNPCEVVAVHLG